MNEEAQEIFDKLVKLDPSALTDEDILFLKARRSYLTTDLHRIFDETLGLKQTQPEEDKKK